MNETHKNPRWMAIAAAGIVILGVLAEGAFKVRNSWYVAIFAGIATYIITRELVDWWRHRDRSPFTYQEPSEAEIILHYEQVRRYAEGLGPIRPGMLESATFLLDEAKGDFERVLSSSDSHEEKARAVIAIVAGATSALGIFGVSKDGRAVVASPIVVDSLIFVLVAFVCLLYVLRVKRYKRPNLATYFAGAMAREELRVALRLSLTPAYAKMTAELAHRIRQEPRALFVAYIAVVAAAVLVLLNAASSNSGVIANVASSASSIPSALRRPPSSLSRPPHSAVAPCPPSPVGRSAH
jgi:hypothetical protein